MHRGKAMEKPEWVDLGLAPSSLPTQLAGLAVFHFFAENFMRLGKLQEWEGRKPVLAPLPHPLPPQRPFSTMPWHTHTCGCTSGRSAWWQARLPRRRGGTIVESSPPTPHPPPRLQK